MANNEWRVSSGGYDPYRKQGQMVLTVPGGGMVQCTGLLLSDVPAGEPAQQKMLQKEVAARLRAAADYLDSL